MLVNEKATLEMHYKRKTSVALNNLLCGVPEVQCEIWPGAWQVFHSTLTSIPFVPVPTKRTQVKESDIFTATNIR